MNTKYIFPFSDGNCDKDQLGNKGAILSEMTKMNIPVPPGFVISTDVCKYYYANNRSLPENFKEEVQKAIIDLESKFNGTRKFGDKNNPLLVSVRSGSRVSMPGMMDTILNVGINDDIVKGLAKTTNNERFAYDSYRRFIQMYSSVVLGIPHDEFESILDGVKASNKIDSDVNLTTSLLKDVIAGYKDLVYSKLKRPFPMDPWEQVITATSAVFESWNSDRAITYRKINNIPEHYGTAVTIQSMVFGNIGNDSGTGVVFTRNPANGEHCLFGEFLINAQGEDVVAGIRTPETIEQLKNKLPAAYDELVITCNNLERYYRDMQDIEFTIQNGKLWLLQARSGKRTVLATAKIAHDMANTGIISREEAVKRQDLNKLHQLKETTDIENIPQIRLIAKGLPACPGIIAGKVVFDPDEAVKMTGEDIILVRHETSPDDIHGMHAAKGFVTARGGITSHAAVVARSMEKPCVVGCKSIVIDDKNGSFTVGDVKVMKGDVITIDGVKGEIYLGSISKRGTKQVKSNCIDDLLSWANSKKIDKDPVANIIHSWWNEHGSKNGYDAGSVEYAMDLAEHLRKNIITLLGGNNQ